MSSEITICRCEDVTEEDVVRAVREYGLTTLDELKRVLRIGMGPCQGRTCLRLAARILARETGRSTSEVMSLYPRVRPPIIPLELGLAALLEGGDGGGD